MLADTFTTRGYRIVPMGEAADVVVINTCTVTGQADAKCRQLVRQVLKQSPGATVAVVGCYAQTGAGSIQEIEGIDYIVGTERKMEIAEIIDIPQKLPRPLVLTPRIKRNAFTVSTVGNYEHATRANLKIQDGCDAMCTFCIIPFARGRARSRTYRDIQREATALVARGHRELVLTGVNIGTYAFDGKDLLDVVKMLETIDGLERIRISSIEPATLSDALLRHMAESEKLCPHLHIPVQSGDDRILAAMRRQHTRKVLMDLMEKAHRLIPRLCLGTDVMVGFPGEDEEAFAHSISLLQACPLAYLHVFTYSDRTGAPAAKMNGKIHPGTKKDRSRILRELNDKMKSDFARRHIGQAVRVLLEEETMSGWMTGYTDNYLRVMMPAAHPMRNTVATARIASIDGSTAIGASVRPPAQASPR